MRVVNSLMQEYESGNDLSYKLFERGESDSVSPSSKEILDKIETSGSIQSSPIIYDNTIFFGSNDHYLYAISMDGELRWKFKTGGPITTMPRIYGGSVFFSSFDNNIYALSAKDGNLLWSFRTGGRLVASPAISENKIYFGSEDGYFYCITTNGDLEWKLYIVDITTTPIVVNGVVYVASLDKRLYAIKDGEKLWSFLTGGFVCPPIAVDKVGEEIWGMRTAKDISKAAAEDGRICFGSFDNYFYTITFDGRLDWKIRCGDTFTPGKPVATAKNGMIYFGNYDKYLRAVSLEDGREVWRFSAGDAVYTPILYRNALYFGSLDGYLYSVDLNGKLIWKFKTSGPITAVPLVNNDILYFGSWDTFLYAISISGPKVLWEFQTGYGNQSSRRLFDTVSKYSRIFRTIQRLWKPETKTSPYEKETPQQNFTFGPAYRMQEPYKMGTEYEMGKPYTMERKKKDWKPF